MTAAVRALRGATTVDADTAEQVRERTIALLEQMVERNGVDHDDLISVLFTATDDIHSMFPATAARDLGLGDVPLHLRPRARHRRRHAPLHPGADAPHHRAGARRAAPRVPRGCRRPARRPPGVRRPPWPPPRGRAGARQRRRDRAHRRLDRRWPCAARAGTSPAATATPRRPRRALELGAIDARRRRTRDAELTFVATPGRAPSPTRSAAALADTDGLVTDVGSVKAPLLAADGRPPLRRRPSHGRLRAGGRRRRPRRPVRGRAPGCSRRSPAPTTTPSPRSAPSWPASAPRSCPCPPSATTRMVAVVSHVPHLTAATLMGLADERAESTAACCAWPPVASAT